MLPEAVSRALTAAGVGPGARLCCALSGGVDSLLLLEVLHELAPQHGYALQAAHVHHGLSPHADAWAQACASRCAQLRVSFSLIRVEVPRDDRAGLEAAARRERLAALDAIPCDWLAFGHHQDDQAETLLFRLLRGSGVRGAAAMPSFEPPSGGRPGRLRPLLDCRRAGIEAWARARGLEWVEDESNADVRFSRNYLRHRVLPLVGERFPAAVPTLARAARHFREASELLDELAALDQAACGGESLQRRAVLALSDARIANLLRWQARRHGWRAPAQARLDEALRQLRVVALAHPLRVVLGDMALCAYRDLLWLESVGGDYYEPRDWCGGATLPWGVGQVGFTSVRGQGIARSLLDEAHSLRLAGRRPGMRLRLEAGRPRREFKNLCQEAGIPAWLRDRLPVLWVDEAPAWVGGIGVAAEFACAPGHDGLMPEWRPARVVV